MKLGCAVQLGVTPGPSEPPCQSTREGRLGQAPEQPWSGCPRLSHPPGWSMSLRSIHPPSPLILSGQQRAWQSPPPEPRCVSWVMSYIQMQNDHLHQPTLPTVHRFVPSSHPWSRFIMESCCVDEDMKAWRGAITCPKPHGFQKVKPR